MWRGQLNPFLVPSGSLDGGELVGFTAPAVRVSCKPVFMTGWTDLPIYEIEQDVIRALSTSGRLIVQAPTASGKSTQVPQMLLDQGLLGEGEVIILQPRRLAARLLARFVAQQREGKVGDEVGFQIRFEDVTSPATRIKFVTEGILLRRLIRDPTLQGVSAVIFDEFHERHLYGDITLARALDLQENDRPDLKVIVMSATMDTRPLARYMEGATVLESEGRTYPVDIQYIRSRPSEREPIWETTVTEFERLVRSGMEGDVLIFMPGGYEIQRTIRELKQSGAADGFVVLPLHGEQPPADQDKAIDQYDQPKVIVSTNVAETSLTIEGITTVIDSGLARVPRFDAHRGINTLWIEKISTASADQRAGRAGRTAPGHCVRLWTEKDQGERRPSDDPEVKRLDLSEVILTLKAADIEDLTAFRWLDRPEPRALELAEALLVDLGALDEKTRSLTETGRRMLAFPIHPRYARMLIEAGERDCVRAVALIAALTQGRDLLLRNQNRQVRERRDELFGDRLESDFFRLIQAWQLASTSRYSTGRCRDYGIHAQAARQVGTLFDSFVRIAENEGLQMTGSSPRDEDIRKCVLAGFADHLARRLDKGTLRCEVVHRRKGELDRDSAVRDHELFVAAEIHEIEGRDTRVVLALATGIEEAWLAEVFPDAFHELETVHYDRTSRRVVGEHLRLFRDLTLDRRGSDPSPERAAELLADEVLKGELTLKHWDHSIEQWIIRVNFLAEHCPDLGMEPIGDDDRRTMTRQICHGAFSQKDIRERDVKTVVHGWLAAPLRAAVDREAPVQVAMPDGKRARILYAAGQPPRISRRIQDIYDLRESPRIAMRRVLLVVEILGPNMRAVQTTQDMAGFWADTYPKIKKELQRKYPKHEWR